MSSKYRLFASKTNGKGGDEVDGLDWVEFTIRGGSVALGLVKEASNYAPVPGLQQAASAVLQIVQTIQQAKDNKAAWRILADEATALIAVVWSSYQKSSSKENWPPDGLRTDIQNLVVTMAAIDEFATQKVKRSGLKRLVSSSSDLAKINEYRSKLRSSVERFEVSSHLKMNSALDDLMRNTLDIIKRLERLNIVVERTDTEKVISQLNQLSIDQPETPPTPPVGMPVPEVNPPIEADEVNRQILASADRYLDRERAYFAGEKEEKGTRSKSQSYRSATVESDDDDDAWEENDQDDDMYVDDPAEEAPMRKNNAKRSRGGLSVNMNGPVGGAGVSMNATLPGLSASMNTPMNAAQGHQGYVPNQALFQGHSQHSPSPPPQYSQSGINTQPTPAQSYPSPQSHPSTPLQQSHIPTSPYQPQYFQQFPNQAYSPPFSPPPMGPQHPYFAGFPPTHHMTGFPIYGYGIPNQPMPMTGYGPGAVITNNNSGNVSNMNISNANNDHSVTTYNSNVLRSGLHAIFVDPYS
ncbi:hypothetical protein HYPSUDRAFT_54966 [Hypholoma sublateritium FD-334 SS-4]|uniref:Uncharacterized protein n=1 Tax=Hypholoma sublateritium (strain FD-334 SS-4) TaxID=945553 RepID=A0A0D2MF81_HYPSF|nr:hypothetical protein HYPSUDRAFT_54966 [Hypholoma sublateritium FD-334 SS-4]